MSGFVFDAGDDLVGGIDEVQGGQMGYAGQGFEFVGKGHGGFSCGWGVCSMRGVWRGGAGISGVRVVAGLLGE